MKHRNCTNFKIKYISDNLELINRRKEHSNYNNPYPNTTLSADYDIIEHIYLTNKTYKIKALFLHVYGHQDTKSRREMSTEVTLNVIVDKLAGDYQDQLSTYTLITHICIHCHL